MEVHKIKHSFNSSQNALFSLFHVKGKFTPCKVTTGLINMFNIHAALAVLQQSKGILQKHSLLPHWYCYVIHLPL